ncbi:Hypothetical Protein FCC1311_021072 [Hondaea fermentalgiana]|uniref:Uncharacterized protein n=1 Tax=Hondaea fermentalgiana TaxID=2315210 RepID=A0A2R5G7W7_9STRA|nr:Hypothetical Protein FCC1311_021072 [Hondaea fermentalgiana]|eukprot:GBG25888.1 Hypothetical Protein FCC1311_021072 [Hondaea fermentalgiana]
MGGLEDPDHAEERCAQTPTPKWPTWLEARRTDMPEAAQRVVDLFMMPAAPPARDENGAVSSPAEKAANVAALWNTMDKQEAATRVLGRTLATGGVGAACGMLLSFKHHVPMRRYALNMGLNFSFGGLLYFSLLESVNLVRPQGIDDPFQYGAVGALTGSALVGLFGSPTRIPGGAFFLGAIAVGGYYVNDAFHTWRKQRGEEIRAQYARDVTGKETPSEGKGSQASSP